MINKELKRILLVDDQKDILVLVQMSLVKYGKFIVETCDNGLAAIEKALVFKPDLILLDVMMPEMDGPTTLIELRKSKELDQVPVVFFTARAQPDQISHYKEIGGFDVIPKPFNHKTISNVVSDIWNRFIETDSDKA